MNETNERNLCTVPESAKHGEETHGSWVERSVWSDRMLKTLATGMEGRKWFSLIDKVYSKANLYAAFRKVARNIGGPGVDNLTIKSFGKNLDKEIEKLHKALKEGSYHPKPIKRVMIPKPGSCEKRPLGIPTVRDRVVQTAVRHVLEPIFEKDFAEHSYGFRPNRGCKDALRRVDSLLRKRFQWVVDADLKSYFDTIPHDLLMERMREKVSDGRVLDLIKAFLKQKIWEEGEEWEPETGSPQGATLSPLLANIFLDPLDHRLAKAQLEYVRYADDVMVLCRTEEEAKRAHALIKDWCEEVRLILHPEKTTLVNMGVPGGIDFLGFHFEWSRHDPTKLNRWPRKKSMKAIRARLKPLTKRANGNSLETIINQVNPILKGWFEYFKQSKSGTFTAMDGWVRGRLRSILRKRQKKKGRARGDDHHRWPNAFFHKHGLFSVAKAHSLARQSSRR